MSSKMRFLPFLFLAPLASPSARGTGRSKPRKARSRIAAPRPATARLRTGWSAGGLAVSAKVAAEFLPLADKFDVDDRSILCPDRALVESHRAAIERVLTPYRYEQLYYSQFFPAESAWYRLSLLDQATKEKAK